MRRLLIPLFAVLALITAACGDDDGGDTAATTTTSADPTSSTSEPADPDPAPEWVRCENPEGFSIGYPADWETNDGSVTEACSAFDPEPFEVPEATDARFAAISAYVDQVDFADAASPEADEESRATTTVDGRQAVRVTGPAGELYEGETAVRYFVDLSLGTDDGPGTLIIDTLSDDDEVVRVLDRMVKTIELTASDARAEDVVARYEGGGTPFDATLAAEGDDWCVTAPADGESTTECFTVPSADALRFADFGGDLFAALGGVTGPEVFRVEAVLTDGSFDYLPVATTDAVRGWMIPVPASDITQLNWFDIEGEALGAREFDAEDGPDAIGAFAPLPQETDDFPASGETSYLTDVRVSGHDGFDRLVFEFDGDAFSWELTSVDEVMATSGEEVEVDGELTYQLVMTPASGVDLSGEEPVVTYDGPQRVDPTTTAIVEELVAADDFEATMTWAIGVGSAEDVAVAFLDGPTRLVVDIETT